MTGLRSICILMIFWSLAGIGINAIRAQVNIESFQAGMLDVKMRASDQQLSPLLLELESSFRRHQRRGLNLDLQPYLRYGLRFKDTAVLIEAIAGEPGEGESLLAAMQEIGLQPTGSYEGIINGFLPIERLSDAGKLSQLRGLYPVIAPSLQAGSALTQGDRSMYTEKVRRQSGLSGRGVKVGILSDSYNTLAGAAAGIASGDLPGPANPAGRTRPVQVLRELFFTASDEGRAMAEIVHDIAPDADMAFHTAFLGRASFASGIIELRRAGCDIITDDVRYFRSPFFQDGIIAQAIDRVVAEGAHYFVAAGNSAERSYEKEFKAGITVTVGGVPYTFHDFGGGDHFQKFRLPPRSAIRLSLQWDQPAFSISGAPGAASDIDIFIINEAITSALAFGLDFNIGGDPVETISYTNATDMPQVLNIGIGLFGGPPPGLIKYIDFQRDARFLEFEEDTRHATSFGNANAGGAISVGAAFWGDTPAFGQSPPLLEFFSSRGGVPILFDLEGKRLASPLIRQKPEIVAPDGGNTTFFGFDIPEDSDVQPNFFGTSAAAPHAAAMAALMKEQYPGLSPARARQMITEGAIDMQRPGFDFFSGAGLIRPPGSLRQFIVPAIGRWGLIVLVVTLLGLGAIRIQKR